MIWVKKGYSRPGLFGTLNHYDSNGKKIGFSSPGLFGSMNNNERDYTDSKLLFNKDAVSLQFVDESCKV